MSYRPAQHTAAESADFEHAGVRSIVRAADKSQPKPVGWFISEERWAIITARFNDAITDALFDGAVDALLHAGASVNQISAFTVPGAVELPLLAQKLAATGKFAGIVVLGCVIRGETAHFDYVCDAATSGVMRVQLDTGVPIGFGLVTCDTVDQARARSQRDPNGRNMGADAARAAVELAQLLL